MNPATLLSLGLPALVAWSILDDYEKARIKRGLSPTVEIDEPDPIEYQYAAPQPTPIEYKYDRPGQGISPPLDAEAATVTTPEPPKPKTFDERKTRLIEVLGEHGLIPIWELRNATPIRFTGWQRSGKSTKAQVLALLRQIDDLDHPVTVCTPHHRTPGDRAWSTSFTTTGEGNRWEEIKSTIDRLMVRLGEGNTTPYTTILDEFSGYAGKVGDDRYIQELMMSAVREMAKHNEMLILIAHGDTMAMNGNIKGLSQAMWGNFVTVQCHRVLRDGKPSPSPRVQISGGGFPGVTLNWPDWFDPEWLLDNFPEVQAIVPKTLVNSIPTLGRAEPVTMPEIEAEPNTLEPHLKAIVDYIARKGEATPRQIQTAKLKPLTDGNINKIDAIQLSLDVLVYEGILEISGMDTYRLVDCGNATEERVEYHHSLPQRHLYIHTHNPHPENL